MAAAGPMGRLPPLPTIKEVLKMYNVHALKGLGQNFLLDPKLISKVISCAAPIKDKVVLEVGPGPGSLSRCILGQFPRSLICIEKDKRFIPSIQLLMEASNGRMSCGIGDIRNFSMQNIFPKDCAKEWDEDPPPIHLIGNLPFNISLPLIIQWLEMISKHSSAWAYGRVPMTLTFQEEVAERMVAAVGHPQRSRLSLMCQNWCEVRHDFSFSGAACLPPPKVDIGVVTLTPRVKPLAEVEFALYEKLCRVLFNAKNNACVSTLKNLFPIGKRELMLQKLLTVADVDPEKPTIKLTNDDVTRLALTYAMMQRENKDDLDVEHGEQRLDFDSTKL